MAKKLLTISLLVSNRIDTIEKCLSSLKPIIDALDADLIVVDTVGEENSDGSLEVAKKYTDNIIHFDWIKDFAAARNVGIDAADSEWFMFIDDDEWFENTDNIIDFFKSGEYKNYTTANYYIRNYTDYEGHYSMTQVMRLFKMEPGVRFFGAIHEKLNVSFVNAKCIKDFIHHYGYAYKTHEEYIEKVMRNRPIIEEMIKNNPNNIDIAVQYLVEVGASGGLDENYMASKKFSEQFISKMATPAYTLILSYYFLYMSKKEVDLEETEAEYKKYYQIGKLSQVAPPIIDFFMGKIYMANKKYRKAIRQFERYRAGVTLVKERLLNYESLVVGLCVPFYEKEVWDESLYLQALCFLVLCPIEGLDIQGYELDEEGIKLLRNMSEKDKLNNQLKAFLLLKDISWGRDNEDFFNQMLLFLHACKIRKRMYDFDESISQYLDSDIAVFTALRAFFEAGYELPDYLLLIDVERIKKFVAKYPQYVENAKKMLVDRKRLIELNSLKEQLTKEINALRAAGKNDEAKELINEAKKLGVEIK